MVVSCPKQLSSSIFTLLCKINHNYIVLVLAKGGYICSPSSSTSPARRIFPIQCSSVLASKAVIHFLFPLLTSTQIWPRRGLAKRGCGIQRFAVSDSKPRIRNKCTDDILSNSLCICKHKISMYKSVQNISVGGTLVSHHF